MARGQLADLVRCQRKAVGAEAVQYAADSSCQAHHRQWNLYDAGSPLAGSRQQMHQSCETVRRGLADMEHIAVRPAGSGA